MDKEAGPQKPRTLPTAGHGSRIHPRFEGMDLCDVIRIVQTEDDRAYLIRSGVDPALLAPYPDDSD